MAAMNEGTGFKPRQKWETGKITSDMPIDAAAVKEEILPQYEEYLLLLQERNRLLKHLRRKDKQQVLKERKEKGFCIYVNGANNSLPAPALSRGQPRVKTANESRNPAVAKLHELHKESEQSKRRVKTAPARERRRTWNVASVDINTTEGHKKIKAPEYLSGKYEDDFEEIGSSDNDDISDVEESVSSSSSSLFSPRKEKKVSYIKRLAAVSRDNTLTLTLEDVHKLRQSLQKHEQIRQSMCLDVTSASIDACAASLFCTSDDENSDSDKEIEEELSTLKAGLKVFCASDSNRLSTADSTDSSCQSLSSMSAVSVHSKQTDESDGVECTDWQDRSDNENNPEEGCAMLAENNRGCKRSMKECRKANSSDCLFLVKFNDGDMVSTGLEKPGSVQGVSWPCFHMAKHHIPDEATAGTSFGGWVCHGSQLLSESSEEEIVEMLQPQAGTSTLPARREEEDEEEIVEELGDTCMQDESGSEKDGEEFEEIEEDLVPDRGRPLLAPTDTIVLEFAPLASSKNKIEKNLALARKKDADFAVRSSVAVKSSTSTPVRKSSSSGSLDRLKDSDSSSRAVRCVGRISQDSKEDPAAQASAVLKAVKEENQQAERFAKVLRPLPEPCGGNSGRPLPEPRKLSSNLALPSYQSSHQSLQGDNLNGSDPVASVVEKVLSMPPKQQRDLMKTLSKIDDSLLEASWLKPEVKPAGAAKKAFSESKHVAVRLEILSNWGHASRVGLTELQLLSSAGTLVPVPCSSVSVHGAHGQSAPVTVLFNGKAKTSKERNMWSCQWTGRPIEVGMDLHDCQPFSLRLWNWNKSLVDLDVGVRHVRVSVGNQLLFDGEVEKGCGNHVFDYSRTIPLTPTSCSTVPPPSTTPAQSGTSRPTSLHSLPTPATREASRDAKSPSKGLNPPHLPLPAHSSSISTHGGLTSPLKSSSAPTDNHHHTFRSISRSSASSASSSGSRPSSQNEDRQIGSEMRSQVKPASLVRQRSNSSDRSSPEGQHGLNNGSLPDKKASKTPRMAKRMAAKLDICTSDIDTSRSNTDSVEQKPPLPPEKTLQRSTEKGSNSRSVDKPPTARTSKAPAAARSPRGGAVSVCSREELQGSGSVEETQGSVVEQLKNMNSKENKRRKDFPKWLSSKDSAAEVKTPTSAGDTAGQRGRGSSQHHDDDNDQDIHSQLDQELAAFSQSQSQSVPATTKTEKSKTSCTDQDGEEEEEDEVSPMQQIKNKRSRWRAKQSQDLEVTWGSLSFFNKSQRGRLSLDMADDILDEYLSPKQAQSEVTRLPIPVGGFNDDDDSFVIPELPSGQEMVINIQSTWGDRHYVGLTSLQLFASSGQQILVTKITADPPDINVLPGYSNDPRVVANLLDGVNRTRDDTHMWLAPFTPGKNNIVYLTFAKPCSLALIRVWNYNKSRIHSYRGAKDMTITLDGTVIFKGEIARACGGIEGTTEAFGDTILFTTDESILEAVSKNDDAFEGEMLSDEEDVPFQRPSTADTEEEDDDRPLTRAVGKVKREKKKEKQPESSMVTMVTMAGDILVYKAHKLVLNFIGTWGDQHYLGLTALELVGKDGEAVPLTLNMLSAQPQDVRHLKGHECDARTLDKLIDGTMVTTSDEHMWLVPFTTGQSHTVTITFAKETLVSGVRIWNYNKSSEDTYRGARQMQVYINDRLISPPEGFLVRKGPGNCNFDFAQEISFTPAGPSNQTVSRNASSASDRDQMPCGFLYQLQLFSTWGDPYYVGLNGIELYDASLNKVTMTQSNISAHPDSINVLEQIQNDVRTPDKLIDGVNDTLDGRHMWLAPILPGLLNRVYIIFDQPTTISMIKMWNYSKTPTRGVKDFALLVDDLLVCNGTISAVKTVARGILPTVTGPQQYHTLLFTDNPDIERREKHTIISNQAEDQDVQLLNDKKIVTKHADPSKASSKPVNQALRPKTGVTEISKQRR